MSVWTNIQGTVSIYKKDRVSIKEVIYNTLTDESMVHVDTEVFPDNYRYHINCNVCIDGYDFIKHYEQFLKELKPIKGTLDLECQLRFIG
jgi:hypothetical protein